MNKVNLDSLKNIEILKITGELNGTDIMVIRKMENLKLLDLKDAQIVNGGMSYYQNYTTSENKIGDFFFSENKKMYSIILPENITEIKYCALTFCPLKTITIPKSVKSIGDTFWTHGYSLIISDLAAWCNINLGYASPSGGIVYKRHLVLNDIEIEDLVIPEGVTQINRCVFSYNYKFRSVTIPQSVTKIEKYAFYSVITKSVTSLNPIPPEMDGTAFVNEEELTLYVPKGSKTLYWLHPYWEKFKNIVELDDTSINDVKLDVPKMNKGVYTIDGVKVSENADNIESLPKGIYIVNGEKVIIK